MQVEVRFGPRPTDDDFRAAGGLDLLGHILVDLIATWPDRRSDPGYRRQRVAEPGSTQLAHRRSQNTLCETPPTRMDRRHGLSRGNQHRYAVGDEDRRGDAGPGHDHGVTVPSRTGLGTPDRRRAVPLAQPGGRRRLRGRHLSPDKVERLRGSECLHPRYRTQEGGPNRWATLHRERRGGAPGLHHGWWGLL